MFQKESYIKRKIRALSWKIFNIIENNGVADFKTNGEELFVDNLFSSFKDKIGCEIVVFDIGANIGRYADMLEDKALVSNVNLKLHLFEPMKSCFNTLCKKFEAKNNIFLNNFGVSNIDNDALIYYNQEESGLASLYQRNLESYNLKLNQSETIKLRRIDSYIEEQNIKHVDFIKIDIEGHELKALEGFGKYLATDYIDYIQFEYGGANLDSHTSLMEIYDFLKKRGFKIAKIMPNGLVIREYKPFMDNFQYANYVAISERLL